MEISILLVKVENGLYVPWFAHPYHCFYYLKSSKKSQSSLFICIPIDWYSHTCTNSYTNINVLLSLSLDQKVTFNICSHF